MRRVANAVELRQSGGYFLPRRATVRLGASEGASPLLPAAAPQPFASEARCPIVPGLRPPIGGALPATPTVDSALQLFFGRNARPPRVRPLCERRDGEIAANQHIDVGL